MNNRAKVEIIAEVAQGFEGNQKLAELLAKAAVNSGADAVKYQLVIADELAVPSYEYYDLFHSLEMSEKIWQDLVTYIKENGSKVYFDIYGETSLELAKKMKADGVKISTTDTYNVELITKAVNLFDRLFLSIGGVPVDDIEHLLSLTKGKTKVTLMYGYQSEPTSIEENNLLKIKSLIHNFPEISLGFMDHSEGSGDEAFYLSMMALALGVDVIEKHITLDRELEIEDFISALTPLNFKKFVSAIKVMTLALGNESLEVSDAEKVYKDRSGKVVVLKGNIDAGVKLQSKDLALKRVGVDGSPGCFRKKEDVIGKLLKNRGEKNQPIMENDL